MKNHYKNLRVKIIVVILFFYAAMMPGPALSKDLGFHPGEKLIFQVRWAFIVAGEVTLEILPYQNFNGKPAFHFLYTAKTSKFVDVFYKVRDRIDSFADIDLTHSLLYIKSHNNGESTKNASVEFDWKNKEAKCIENGNKEDPIQISENTFDPLSVFYAFRIGQPNADNEIIVHVSDGKKIITATGKIIKKQKIKVAGKSYNTILVEPEIEGVSGVFKKTKHSKLKIWVTDDKKRIPVRIKSRVTVGSFVADLVGYVPGNSNDSALSANAK